MEYPHKRKRTWELALSFWIGVGLMSVINIWKITQNMNALWYSRIMSFVSGVFIIICVIYLISINKKSKRSG